MDKRAERILHRAEKAALKKARREGHSLSPDEISGLKVQILSNPLRWSMAGAGIACGLGSWVCLEMEKWVAGSVLAVISVLLIAFAIFGIRRTLEVLDVGDLIVEGVVDFLSDVW